MNLLAGLGIVTAALALGAGCYRVGEGEDSASGGASSGSGGTSSAGVGGTTGGGSTSTGAGGSTSGSGGAGIAGGSTGGVSGSSSGSGGVGAAGDNSGGSAGAYQCTGDGSVFETFDKSCTNDGDCVLVSHTTTCCGDTLLMGINADEQQRFSAAEMYCSAQFPACGCAAQGISAEDGSLVQFGSEDLIVARCTDGSCNSEYSGPTFQCANALCTEEQYCRITTGGPAGSEPSGSCYFDGGCKDCSCLGSVGCQCADEGEHLTVTCAAP